MQYTAKVAILAVALFGTSALAAPIGSNAENNVEAREVDNDLSAREFYLEARADPSVDARDLDSVDLEAREYLEHLEARDAAIAPASPPQKSIETSLVSYNITTIINKVYETVDIEEIIPQPLQHEDPKHFHTPHQLAVHAAGEAADLKFQVYEVYQQALKNKNDKLHKFAVVRHLLDDAAAYKKALANKKDQFHKAAMRIDHHSKALKYLDTPENLKKALNDKKDEYHKAAVKKYFSLGDNFKNALNNAYCRFHNAAVLEYLRLKEARQRVLKEGDKKSEYYKIARKMQDKFDERRKLRRKHKLSAGGKPRGRRLQFRGGKHLGHGKSLVPETPDSKCTMEPEDLDDHDQHQGVQSAYATQAHDSTMVSSTLDAESVTESTISPKHLRHHRHGRPYGAYNSEVESLPPSTDQSRHLHKGASSVVVADSEVYAQAGSKQVYS